jgi:hypothetical protein
MKKHILDFLRRGIVSCGFGPLVLAILYWILRQTIDLRTLTVEQVCIGIFSLTVLAFIAGGMNFIYQIERLPLMLAILIHGCVLYVSYLATYLINSWLEWGPAPILSFTGIFVVGYLMIWAVIYTIIKRNTDKINAVLKQKQNNL